MNNNKIERFKRDLKQLFERHGLSLWFVQEECYECSGGTLNIVDLAEGTLDVDALEWRDLAAEKAEEAQREAEQERIYDLWRRQAAANRRLGAALLPVFDTHQLVFWSPLRWYGNPLAPLAQVRALPFTEGRWAALKAHAPFLANSLRSRQLTERQITDEHRARLPAFWRDAEEAMRRAGLIPVNFGNQADITNTEPEEDAEPIRVSPRFDDPIPEWLNPAKLWFEVNDD